MTIAEQVKIVVEELIDKNNGECVISNCDLVKLVNTCFGRTEGSIMARDYCYNRVNKDPRSVRNPRLFEFLGNGRYRCLGEKYLYTGEVYTQPAGAKDKIVVGNWENGVFTPNENWEKCGLKECMF